MKKHAWFALGLCGVSAGCARPVLENARASTSKEGRLQIAEPPKSSIQLFGPTERAWRLRSIAPHPSPDEVRAVENVDPSLLRAELYKPGTAAAQLEYLGALAAADAATFGKSGKSFQIGINRATWRTEAHGSLQIAYLYYPMPRGDIELLFCRLVYDRVLVDSGRVALSPLNEWCGKAMALFADAETAP